MSEKMLEELRAEAGAIADKIYAIEAAGRVAEHKKMVGKTFRCRNSYSCPNDAADYWWLWIKVLSCNEDGWLTAFTFQTDCHGQITIKMDETHCGTVLMQNRVPASLFRSAWRKVQRQIAKAKP